MSVTVPDAVNDQSPERVDLGALDLAASLALPLRLAVARLICFPTDTVYGIGGALSAASAEAIVAAKGREAGKPLQVIFPNREVLLATVPLGRRLTDACLRLLPGPVTLVVPYPAEFTCPPPASPRPSSTSAATKRRAAGASCERASGARARWRSASHAAVTTCPEYDGRRGAWRPPSPVGPQAADPRSSGSAAGPLAVFFTRAGALLAGAARVVLQGVYVGRPRR